MKDRAEWNITSVSPICCGCTECSLRSLLGVYMNELENKVDDRGPTPIEKMTWEGRCIEDAKQADYCGSCSLDVHVKQMRDPSSWVNFSPFFIRWLKAYGDHKE